MMLKVTNTTLINLPLPTVRSKRSLVDQIVLLIYIIENRDNIANIDNNNNNNNNNDKTIPKISSLQH